VRVTMDDNVTRIEGCAFFQCFPLRSIRFSINLEYLGNSLSISAHNYKLSSFLPPSHTSAGMHSVTVLQWDSSACQNQSNSSVRGSSMDVIDYWPQSITMKITMSIGLGMLKWINGWCNDMPSFRTIKLAPVLPSLLKGLKLVFKNTESNELRRLTINKWRQCLFFAPIPMLLEMQFVPTYFGSTSCQCASQYWNARVEHPLLRTSPSNFHKWCHRAYLKLVPEAANEQDSDGMTPLQYLCMSDINFLEDRNFSSLMIWWYHCMPWCLVLWSSLVDKIEEKEVHYLRVFDKCCAQREIISIRVRCVYFILK